MLASKSKEYMKLRMVKRKKKETKKQKETKKEKKEKGGKIAYIKFKSWILFIGYFLTTWGLNLGPSTC